MGKKIALTVIVTLMISLKVNSALVTIDQSGTSFSPSNINVNVGDVIRWVWSSGTHSSTSITIPNGAASWDGSLTSSNTIFEYTVTVAGNYTYHCSFHSGMNGSFTASESNSIESKTFSEYKIFPNPSSSIINLPNDLLGSIHLFDVIGKELKQIQYSDLTMNGNYSQFNISNLANGVYFIAYVPDITRKRITWKFIKK